MGFKPTALFTKKLKELKVLVLQRTEVDDNCRYVVVLLISGRTFVSFSYRFFSGKGQGGLSYKLEATI